MRKSSIVFNKGNLSRDFTYIDDIIDGLESAINLCKKNLSIKYKIYNLGNNSPVRLSKMISLLENILEKRQKEAIAYAVRRCKENLCRYRI